ncbi:MAG TPA: sigma-70 family RNA polymerase sigma factor [Phycisphaerae bacterium]|nr:sigma-70 family RNA polymerase sigma factor [Phycisphaerae bacterium]
MTADRDLLLAYARDRDEAAFAAIIERYLRLVYAACWRQLRDRHLAEDATQAVFVLLSQKAAAVRPERLSGWLLTAARFTCAAIRKRDGRRGKREEASAMRDVQTADPGQRERDELLALLDEALGRLKPQEREAVARRYLQEQSLRDVGAGLHLSEEAARKRVDRGVEKLRAYFARRGIVSSAAVVATVLAAHNASAAALPAPHLSAAILLTCRAGGSAVTLAQASHAMMTAARTKLVAASIAAIAIAATGTWLTVRAVALAPAISAAATSAPATSPAFDLSTPENTMRSFIAALNAGDKEKAYACLLVDPQRPPNEFDGCIAWALAQSRLLSAGKTRLNAPAYTLLGGIGIQMFANFADLAEEHIAGDSATLIIPAATLEKLAADSDERIWAGKPMRFKKEGSAWKLDIDHSVTVRMTLMGADNLAPAQARARNSKVLMDLAKLFDQIAEQITDKTLNSPLDVRVAIRSGAREVFEKDGGDDMQCVLAPAGEDADLP